MFKLLIVDDEKLIREGLIYYIDWASLKTEVIGTASNGKSALEQVMNHRPDIILTDIKMPTMDGIELIKTLRENGIDSEVIFISAYSNFEYAKSALKYGAFDYVLKPIEENSLIEVFNRCINKITEKRERHSHTYSADKSRLLHNLIRGKATLSESDLNILKPYIDKDTSIILTLIKYTRDADDSPVQRVITNALQNSDMIKNSGAETIIIDVSTDETAAIFICEDINQQEICTLIKNTCTSLCDALPGTKVSLSSIGNSIKDIGRLYIEASAAPLCEYLGVEGCVKEFSQLKGHIGTRKPFNPNYSRLLNFVKEGDKDRVLGYINNMLFSYINSGLIYDIDVLKIEFASSIDFILDNLNICPHKVELSDVDNSLSFKKELSKQNSITGIQELSKNTLFKIVDYLKGTEKKSNKKLVSLALEYIHKNYSSNITLNEVATSLYITPSYLSKIFGEEVGESYSRYLLKYRIQMAKNLLTNPKYKVYEVAKMVGYNDIYHFTKTFKSVEGVTPTKYRDLH